MNPPLPADLFALDPDHLWVQHCSEGPIPLATAQAIRALLDKETRPWTMRWTEDIRGIPAATRATAARLLGGDERDLTLTPTTSSGLILVAQGFPWSAGDEVLTPLGEFSTNAWPWLALASRGVTLRTVPLWEGHRAGDEGLASTAPTAAADPEARLLAALSPRTRVLALSWVRFQDGLRLDLPRLAEGCQARGVALVVDGIQGLGTAPIDLRGVSALACGGHKGLLAPAGQGFLWTAPAFRARLAPLGSWLSVEGCADFSRPNTALERDWLTDGTRLEQGGYDVLGCAALQSSMAVLERAGVEAIANHVHALQRILLDALAGIPAWKDEAARLGALHSARRLGSILALHHQARGGAFLDGVLRAGFERGIDASVREGYLRIALHGWHTEADVSRLAAWLAA